MNMLRSMQLMLPLVHDLRLQSLELESNFSSHVETMWRQGKPGMVVDLLL